MAFAVVVMVTAAVVAWFEVLVAARQGAAAAQVGGLVVLTPSFMLVGRFCGGCEALCLNAQAYRNFSGEKFNIYSLFKK